MPVENPFKNSKKVTFSYTDPNSNAKVDDNFVNVQGGIIRAHVTTTLEMNITKDFKLNENIDAILHYFPKFKLGKYDEITFYLKDTELKQDESFYTQVKKDATIVIGYKHTDEYWKHYKPCPCMIPPNPK